MSLDKNKFYFMEDNEDKIEEEKEEVIEKEQDNTPEVTEEVIEEVTEEVNEVIIDEVEDIKNISKSNNKPKSKINTNINTKPYLGYKSRIGITLGLLVIFLILTILFALNMFYVSKENSYNYSEYSNLDYKVYLKDNNFYEDEYLNKDMLYVASLIDRINVNFNYKFFVEEKLDINFKYKIYAKLIITDFNDKNVYYEKTYNLVPEKIVKLDNDNTKIINEVLDINYDYYNRIANNFKNSFALSTKSKLIIYYDIDKDINNKNIIMDKTSKNNMFLEIPLSEKSVNIELNSNDINNTNKIILNKDGGIKFNILFVCLSVICFILFIITVIKSIKLIKILFNNKDVYDLYIDKILNEYDRMIVKTTTPPIKNELDNDSVIKVESFQELLDVRDNIKQPIMYYVITKHVKCQFYIKNDNKIYITTVKKVDLEENNEKE